MSITPFIPEDATITISYGGETIEIRTDDLKLDPSSEREDPEQVGTAFDFIADNLNLDGAPTVTLTVIQGFDGSSRFIDSDINSSVEVTSEDISSTHYTVQIQPD